MLLSQLRVQHQKLGPGMLRPLHDGPSFFLETCQRWVEVSWVGGTAGVSWGTGDLFFGTEAYHFLLRLLCGLESQILGETDIFGQFKSAWQQYRASTPLSREVDPWIQRLFEDSKFVRSQYLQSVGGASYGSLVRKLLKEQQLREKSRILLVGSGQIARSIVPFLSDFGLIVSNRDKSRLAEFHDFMAVQGLSAQVAASEELERDAYRMADAVVLCVPMSREQDSLRYSWFNEGDSSQRLVVHLGGSRKEASDWLDHQSFYALDDLFALHKSLTNIRSVQVIQAIQACSERSKMRELGASLSIAHGWEDLACFA